LWTDWSPSRINSISTPLVTDPGEGYGFSGTLDNLSLIVQPHITKAQNRVPRPDQKFKYREEKPISDLPAKLAIHFTGDKETPV
jgi:hypothetical protein